VTKSIDDDLSDPGLTRLFDLARAKFERLGRAGGEVVIAALTDHEAATIAAFWKRSARARKPRRGLDFVCRLSDLNASLTEVFDLGLEEVLIRTGGPLRLLPQERSTAEGRRAAFWDEALGQQLCVHDAAVRSFVERLRRGGSLGKQPYESAKGEALMASLRVGETLPREQIIERSTLANEMLEGPHALDDSTDVGRLLVQQLAARDGLPAGPLAAGDRRALFQRYGVLCDPASATVLTLGLRPTGDSPLERAIRILAGSHVVLTFGQLSAMPPRFEPGLLVRLCENPAVVLRAESQLGATAAPLVCTGGWPGSAVCALLDALVVAGATFAHHGDFDWEGLAIHRWLHERYGVQSWRFEESDYRAAIKLKSATSARLRPSRHSLPDDNPVAEALRVVGVAVSEEALLHELVADLVQEFADGAT
jgi:uncharacterized protein (TIGR02679 family)